MFDATTNRQGNLLIVHFSGAVDREQTRQCVELVRPLIQELKPGFTVITDLGRLEHMDLDCAEDVGKIMDLCNEAKVAHVSRVIPNSEVDIGWSILSRFHYDEEHVTIKTFPSFYKAMKTLMEKEKLRSEENPASGLV